MKFLRPVTLSLSLAILLIFFSSAGAATLTESPANVAAGGTVVATWTTIASPTSTDWIGLYSVGAGDANFREWVYVSCSRTAGSAFTSGNCPSFPVPGNLPNGTYQLRLFANDGFIRLATSGNFNVAPTPPPPLVRFVDNNDGTISDTQTGLMWEKKSGTVGAAIVCTTPTTCPDPHNVNNRYQWSATGTIPDGALFTDFLTKINRADGASSDGLTQDRKNYSDWRIPTAAELGGIVLAPFPCGTSPCIHPVFGPAGMGFHWTSTSLAAFPVVAWNVNFNNGEVTNLNKLGETSARGVRGGR